VRVFGPAGAFVMRNPTSPSDAFFRRVARLRDLLRPFDRVPGLLYIVKDAASRTMAVSPASVPRMGGRTEADVIGLAPADYLPADIARKYLDDDRRVLRTGRPMVNVVEAWINEQGLRDWVVTDKYPLRDRAGRVVGLIGTLHSFQDRRRQLAHLGPVGEAARYIEERLDGPLRLADVAAAVGYSERHLERLFRQVFGMSVWRFVVQSRIHAASRALTQSDRSITQVALAYGFCDGSAFGRAFRAATGLSPKAYRRRHLAVPRT
jgi:AraC-like DNA-binding protein